MCLLNLMCDIFNSCLMSDHMEVISEFSVGSISFYYKCLLTAWVIIFHLLLMYDLLVIIYGCSSFCMVGYLCTGKMKY